jgi:hypothetical protein
VLYASEPTAAKYFFALSSFSFSFSDCSGVGLTTNSTLTPFQA